MHEDLHNCIRSHALRWASHIFFFETPGAGSNVVVDDQEAFDVVNRLGSLIDRMPVLRPPTIESMGGGDCELSVSEQLTPQTSLTKSEMQQLSLTPSDVKQMSLTPHDVNRMSVTVSNTKRNSIINLMPRRFESIGGGDVEGSISENTPSRMIQEVPTFTDENYGVNIIKRKRTPEYLE